MAAAGRTACLLVPDLPLAAALRVHPEWRGEPLALAAAGGPRAGIVSVSEEAARAGVRPGGSVAHARTVCAALRVRVASPEIRRAARAALLDVALAFSPRVEALPRASGAFAAEAAVLLDASGIAALFRSEAGFAAALGERARRVGLPAHVAVAGSRDVAHLAARRLPAGSGGEGRTCIVPPGAEAAFLAPLPIDLLDPDDDLAERLTRFGVRTLRDLRSLPRRQLATRLGPRVLDLVARAGGRGGDPPLPVPPPTRTCEALDLDPPVERREPLLFAMQGLLSRLTARLEVRHLACADLGLELRAPDGARDARRVGVAAPTRDVRVLLRQLHAALEARAPKAPVEGVRIETTGRPLRSDQLDLFRPAGPTPTELGRVVGELASLCGADRVGVPEVADSHHPDATAVGRFDPGGPDARGERREDQEGPNHHERALALRLLRPPLPARVRIDAGRPVRVRSAIANGAVLQLAGPWRTTGGWWSPEGRFAFDHFDVQTEDGTVSRLRFDHVARCWEVDGVYD